MVLDTSAVVAILSAEPEAHEFNEAVARAGKVLISAATLLECTIVIESRWGEAAGRELDLYLHRAAVGTVAVDADQEAIARRAWRRFGKGRHPAALNFGDCFSYALAVQSEEPLLFKGDDFAKTDIAPAIEL